MRDNAWGRGITRILKSNHDFDVDEDDVDEIEENYDIPLEKKKCRNKLDKRWLEAEKILISAVQMRPCLWNNTIEKKNLLEIHEGWRDVLKELKGK